MERFDEIRPGDWLWYYNANGSGAGSHSVIFSHWVDTVPVFKNDAPPYRTAICFSQGQSKKGGREHEVRLGADYNKDPRISPITSVMRVPENTNPADSVDDIVGQSKGLEKRSSKSNTRFIFSVAHRYKFLTGKEHISRYAEEIKLELRARNEQLIDNLYNLTEGQRALLEESNNSHQMHELVRLYQRLKAIQTNQSILQQNYESKYEKLDEKHEKVSEAVDKKTEELQEKIEEQKAILAPHEKRLEKIEEKLESLAPNTREIRRKLNQLLKRRKELKIGSAERRKVQDEINKGIKENEIAHNIARSNRPIITKAKKDKREVESKIKRPNRLIIKYQRELGKSKKELPYGLVHTGRLGKMDKNRARGQLKDIFSVSELRKIIEKVQFSPSGE